MNVEAKDLSGQARAYSILAELYRQTKQTVKSLHHYKKVKRKVQRLNDIHFAVGRGLPCIR